MTLDYKKLKKEFKKKQIREIYLEQKESEKTLKKESITDKRKNDYFRYCLEN